MYHHLAIVLLAHAAIAAPVCAIETYECRDRDGAVTVEYDYQYDAEPPFLRVQMQLTDDFGLSTDPAHEDHDGEYIAATYEDNAFRGVDVEWKDENGGRHNAMRLRLVSVSEGAHYLQTGGLSVGGGGIWTVTCAGKDGTDAAW